MKIKISFLHKIIICVFLGSIFGSYMPIQIIKTMNTLCGFINQILKFMIPLIILSLITNSIANIGKNSTKILLWTLILSYISTIIAGLFSYICSCELFNNIVCSTSHSLEEKIAVNKFGTYFDIEITPIMTDISALVLAFMIGIGTSLLEKQNFKVIFNEFKDIIMFVINKFIGKILPVYILGMFLNLSACGLVKTILLQYFNLIVFILVVSTIYLIFQYIFVGLIIRKNPFILLYNMLPAYFTAIATSSSVATIPVTLKQTIKNNVNKDIADFSIPLCATIHMPGAIIRIVCGIMAVVFISDIHLDHLLFFKFIFMLGIFMIAAPGTPGGAIITAIGVANSILNLSTEQLSILISLDILLDPFGTAYNVTGDCPISMLVEKTLKKN